MMLITLSKGKNIVAEDAFPVHSDDPKALREQFRNGVRSIRDRLRREKDLQKLVGKTDSLDVPDDLEEPIEDEDDAISQNQHT